VAIDINGADLALSALLSTEISNPSLGVAVLAGKRIRWLYIHPGASARHYRRRRMVSLVS